MSLRVELPKRSTHLVCNIMYFAAGSHHALAESASVEVRLWRANPIESEDTSSLRIVSTDGVEIFSHLTLCPDDGNIDPLAIIDADLATITLRDFQTVEVAWNGGRVEVRQAYKENRIEMLELPHVEPSSHSFLLSPRPPSVCAGFLPCVTLCAACAGGLAAFPGFQVLP